jgi:hypothetical protein
MQADENIDDRLPAADRAATVAAAWFKRNERE